MGLQCGFGSVEPGFESCLCPVVAVWQGSLGPGLLAALHTVGAQLVAECMHGVVLSARCPGCLGRVIVWRLFRAP